MESVISPSAIAARRQFGIALIVVLIMLTAMTIAGVALVRIVDSANVISGNFAFRQATLNIADLGVEAAVSELAEIRAGPGLEKPFPANCTSKCTYFPARSTYSPIAADTMVDKRGLPTKGNVDGASQPIAIDWSGDNMKRDAMSEALKETLRGYSIRYVIDRQCKVAPVSNVVNDCINETPQGGGSKKSGATVFSPVSTIFYRVSIQVGGPRNTKSHVQVVLGF